MEHFILATTLFTPSQQAISRTFYALTFHSPSKLLNKLFLRPNYFYPDTNGFHAASIAQIFSHGNLRLKPNARVHHTSKADSEI
jgi:hypothetical protein